LEAAAIVVAAQGKACRRVMLYAGVGEGVGLFAHAAADVIKHTGIFWAFYYKFVNAQVIVHCSFMLSILFAAGCFIT